MLSILVQSFHSPFINVRWHIFRDAGKDSPPVRCPMWTLHVQEQGSWKEDCGQILKCLCTMGLGLHL